MNRRMIDYLPIILANTREIQAIMSTEQVEFESLWQNVDNIFKDQFIEDSTETGVSRWEKILGIVPKATESLSERKFRILTRLNESLPYSMNSLKGLLTTLCGEEGYFLELLNNAYTLVVKIAVIAKSNYTDVESMLKRVVPANMVIDLSIKYNTYFDIHAFTHKKLKAYTHNHIRNEVI